MAARFLIMVGAISLPPSLPWGLNRADHRPDIRCCSLDHVEVRVVRPGTEGSKIHYVRDPLTATH